MSKTHFDPYSDEYAPDRASCGVTPAGSGYCAAGSWSKVTCKRCLSMKERLESNHQRTEAMIDDQMQSNAKRELDK